ncbi:hypothetical protein DFR50_12510 [Roseiarcus fermentans]|uniref:Uncharacterized protein n=1 Tax=Roseiarcus fermentans TaxID=1473586 RepID=A0A366F435_9HYPH|nr:hypothetical protein [Roseiarcus fermentans]RBP08529.1 hypothetical protein DFR50_12510 [Roseiarcus fermentans]
MALPGVHVVRRRAAPQCAARASDAPRSAARAAGLAWAKSGRATAGRFARVAEIGPAQIAGGALAALRAAEGPRPTDEALAALIGVAPADLSDPFAHAFLAGVEDLVAVVLDRLGAKCA